MKIKKFFGNVPAIGPRPCSRCTTVLWTKKAARIHFRTAHGFKCMEVKKED